MLQVSGTLDNKNPIQFIENRAEEINHLSQIYLEGKEKNLKGII